MSFMNRVDVAGTVRAELARQRKPQQSLQDRLKISRATMHRRITGQLPFTSDELVVVADFLGMSVAELFAAREVATTEASA